MSLIDHAAHPADRRNSASGVSVIALIIAAAATGLAIHQNRGEYRAREDLNPHTLHAHLAIGLVTLSLIASIVALIWSKRATVSRLAPLYVSLTMIAALAWQFSALLRLWPVGVDQPESFYKLPYHRQLYLCQISASGLFILLSFLSAPALRRWWFPGLLLFHSLLCFWTIRSSPAPKIDVWHFQQISAATLLHGGNPYDANAVRFPDIYESTLPGRQQVYGDGLVKDNHLTFGFPYLPLSLYCSTLGYLLGDARYAQGIALTVAGLFIGYSRPGRLPKLAAALLLFTPTVWFVLARAWTEPFAVMFLGATIFCACRKWRWLLQVALGLLLASKQYLVLAVPLTFLLIPEFNWRLKQCWRAWIALLIGAGATAAIVTLPLACRDVHAFVFSTVTVQIKAPYRWDALSYLVCICFDIHSKYQTWTFLWVAAVVPMLLLSLWKARRSPAGFATAMAAVYLVFIAFNKQAFCNYYFFVIACFCCAIAASPVSHAFDAQKE